MTSSISLFCPAQSYPVPAFRCSGNVSFRINEYPFHLLI
uniref:Uncharacterized protein n=1 Tax=Megaselia scalaris TaxID=36166 RepID=T1GUU7_MEGSC